jgi:ribonuclease-3
VDELRELVAALPAELRRRAFTHTSWTEERAESYERLEFLGDGVLGLAVAEELCRRYPDYDEGRLAKLRAHIVSRRSCAVVARVLDLGAELEEARIRLGVERAHLDTNRNVLAELCEAAIGACFLGHGYERTAQAVVVAFEDRIRYADEAFVDHKTELQERLARQGASVSYVLDQTTGPAHRRRFTTSAVVDGTLLGTGTGPSKKASEQAAAREALQRLEAGDEQTDAPHVT